MKHFLIFLLFNSCTPLLLAQKPILDSLSVINWPSIGYDVVISNDGNYFMYTIDNQPPGSQTFIIQKTDNSWKKEFNGVSHGLFSADNKQAVIKINDTLFFILLGSEQSNYVPNIGKYNHSKTDKGKWLVYQLKTAPNELVIRNLLTDKERKFTSVLDYSLDKSGKALLLRTAIVQPHDSAEALQWVDLMKNKVYTIWSTAISNHGKTIGSYCFDEGGAQLAFIVQEGDTPKKANTVWYYKVGMDKANVMATNQSIGIEPGYTISSSPLSFTMNGNYIYFKLKKSSDVRKSKPDAVEIDIWSYKDSILQSTQLYELAKPAMEAELFSAFNIIDKKIIKLQGEDEILRQLPATKSDFVVVHTKKSITEHWWESVTPKATYLISLKDGTRTLLDTGGNLIFYSLSPDDKYLVFFKNGAYFSYNISSGKILNISSGIPTSLTFKEDQVENLPEVPANPLGIAGWLAHDSALLVYDDYDIWQVGLSATSPPTNVTNGYGRRNNIKLRLVNDNISTFTSVKSPLLLTAFNTLNKYNGFYLKSPRKKGDPEQLILEPYNLYITRTQTNVQMTFEPLKSSDSHKWIVMRQSADDAPNFFLTTDFKNYRRLTNLQPQKKYNWLSTELITWKRLDGTPSQGVLYKPEDFDPQKKYPIIIHYYERLSQRMYQYLRPMFARGAINIPWFVSRGYLVFTPDIDYIVGRPGESAYNSVVSAAQYLSTMPWVDASRMGINGHSFGGYETNYLITHTNLFRAAATGSGPSNLISHYGGLLGEAYGMESGQSFYETSQMRIGTSLWETPELYIMNSPIFKANDVTTPLLIMHNKADAVVPWMQSVELFTALRRLRKKVWMLQYDDGGHGIKGKEAKDFTIRITQFFDHYLKNAPAPNWMTKGIPAKLKGVETGYELDTSGILP